MKFLFKPVLLDGGIIVNPSNLIEPGDDDDDEGDDTFFRSVNIALPSEVESMVSFDTVAPVDVIAPLDTDSVEE